jgi:hypothetical protein
MIKNYIFVLLTVLCLNSCGKSKEEIELEKAKIELENTKLELADKTKKEENLEAQKIHEQKSNVGKQKKITELNLQLQRLPEALKKSKQNLQNIQSFKIGRSSSTKQKQLTEATNQIDEILSYGEKLKNEIAQLQYLKTFDFQKSPENVMKYIFDSAKKGDFSNFRYLCDPYGENDSDVNQFCNIELLSDKKKDQFRKEIENGRIMSKAKIENDKAEIEFAFGQSSNKLEKMIMINRNGLWYLQSL